MEGIKSRLKEQVRIYRDSPNTTVTFVDLARVLEDIMEIIDTIKKSKVGFNDGGKNGGE